MTYFQVLLIAHGSILAAVVAATVATVLAARLRLGVFALAKYVLPAFLLFYVVGYLASLQWEETSKVALLGSQVAMGVLWFPRCFRPGPGAAVGRWRWRWWSPIMLAVLAETFHTLILDMAWRVFLE